MLRLLSVLRYIPTLATLILLQNEAMTAASGGSFTAASTVPLQAFGLPPLVHPHMFILHGLAMGNALIDPGVQRFAYRHQGLAASLINTAQAAVLTSLEHDCSRALTVGDYAAANGSCPQLLQYIEARAADVNLYDIRRYNDTFSKPLLLALMSEPAMQDALGAQQLHGTVFDSDCAVEVKAALAEDVYHSVAPLLPALFAHTRVLLYNGNMDMKDGSRGTLELLTTLPTWVDRFNFRQAPRIPFPTPATDPSTTPYVFSQTYANVTSVVVPTAGHFSPHDQAQAVLYMLQEWAAGRPLGTAGTACTVPGGCGEEAKRGKCVVDRCECAMSGDVQWTGPRCEVRAYDVTALVVKQEGLLPEDVVLEPQQSVLYCIHVDDDASLPLYIDARARTEQDASMLMDLLYLAPSASLTTAGAMSLMAQFDPANHYYHHHHPLLSPTYAHSTPALLASTRNVARDAVVVVQATGLGYYALVLTNLHSTTGKFALSLRGSDTQPTTSLSSLTVPFNSTAVGMLAALLALAAVAILVIVLVRRCALYRRKGGKRYGKVVEGAGTRGQVVGNVAEGVGEWEEGMKVRPTPPVRRSPFHRPLIATHPLLSSCCGVRRRWTRWSCSCRTRATT